LTAIPTAIVRITMVENPGWPRIARNAVFKSLMVMLASGETWKISGAYYILFQGNCRSPGSEPSRVT
jgi:hypothetical protein